MKRLTQEADFGLEDWEETLLFVKSDPDGAYNITDIAKHVGEPEFDEILKSVVLRLSSIEDILGDDYDLDRLKEIVEADRDGRCVIFPVQENEFVWVCSEKFPDAIMLIYGCFSGMLSDMEEGYAFGKTKEEAEAALRRVQNEGVHG